MTFPLMPHAIELGLAAWGWEFVASSNVNAAAISTPPETRVGDLVVLHDTGQDANVLPAEVVPTGYTKIAVNTADRNITSGNRFTRAVASVRIATQAGAVAISPLVGGAGTLRKMTLVFRPSRPISTLFAHDVSVDPGGPGLDPNTTITLDAPPQPLEGLPILLFFARIWSAAQPVTFTPTPAGLIRIDGSSPLHPAHYRFGFSGPSQILQLSGDPATQMMMSEGFCLYAK